MRNGFLCLFATAVLVGSGSGPWVSTAQGSPNSISAFGQSVSDGFKSGMKKLADAVTPDTPVKPADDPVALSTKAKPSPELHISLGLMAEQKGNFPEAERRYQTALKLQPKHFGALLAYARLKDRQNQFEEAVRLYQEAIQAHPDQATAFNDLALCYARNKRLHEAQAQLERAVQLKPKETLYRNNLATLLVELGDLDRAFQHLATAHGEAVAYYNLGYLLQKKGQPKQAAVLFAKALEKDPSLVEAQVWLEKLGGVPPKPAVATSVPAQVPTLTPSVGVAGTSPHRTMPGLPTRPAITADVPTAPLPGPALPTMASPDLTVPPTAVAPDLNASPRPALPGSRPFMRSSPEARRLPPVTHTGKGLPYGNRAEDAPLPPGYQDSTQGPRFGSPVMAPLPQESPLPSHVQPLPSIGEVIVEP